MDIANLSQIYTEDTITYALLFCFISSFLLFSCFLAFSSKVASGMTISIGLPHAGLPVDDLRNCSRWLKPLFVTLLLASVISLVLLHGIDTFQETWEERRLLDSKFAIVPGLLAETVAILPGIFLLARQRTWAALSLVTAVVLPILHGGRIITVIAISSLYLCVLVKYGTRPWVRLMPLLALPMALAIHTFLRLTRGIDLISVINGSFVDILLQAASQGIDWFGGERTPFRTFLYIVESEMWKSIPGILQTIHRILFFWLPHEVLDKPADVTEWVWQQAIADRYMGYIVSTDYGSDTEKFEAITRAIKEGSTHGTLWGEFLANGGYLAAVPVIFFLVIPVRSAGIHRDEAVASDEVWICNGDDCSVFVYR